MTQAPTFGEILRERRSLLGLTQAELARRAGCAPITVRKLEGDSLRPSFQLAELLALALDISEAEQLAFIRLARQEGKPSPIPAPTLSPIKEGYDEQLAQLCQTLNGIRPNALTPHAFGSLAEYAEKVSNLMADVPFTMRYEG